MVICINSIRSISRYNNICNITIYTRNIGLHIIYTFRKTYYIQSERFDQYVFVILLIGFLSINKDVACFT